MNKPMIPYASNTRCKRNLAAMRSADWRILLTPSNPKPPAGFKFAIDNGAWHAYSSKTPFDEVRFLQLLEINGAAADFVVVPDIVAGGQDSLFFSLKWLARLQHMNLFHLLLPVQDGMNVHDVGFVLRGNPFLGIFLGGSTEYKLREMDSWGKVAQALDRHFHVGRVNTARRIKRCALAGVDSFDGTSATRYATTLPLLDRARLQGVLPIC